MSRQSKYILSLICLLICVLAVFLYFREECKIWLWNREGYNVAKANGKLYKLSKDQRSSFGGVMIDCYCLPENNSPDSNNIFSGKCINCRPSRTCLPGKWTDYEWDGKCWVYKPLGKVKE